jgi:hypothetical protein
MVDFVLEQNEKIKKEKYGIESYYSTLQVLINYANFLKQHLTLGMLVPCDEDGNILEEPDSIGVGNEFYNQRSLDQYEQAKEKVLFEGFHIEGNKLCYSDFYFGVIDEISNLKVENLLSELPENEMPKLTISAIKQIGL